MKPEQYPGLQISEDMRQQKREWAIQPIAWIILYLFLIAIALGLTGSGPLSKAVAGSPEGAVQMEYDRFMRRQSPNSLHMTTQSTSNTVRIMLDSRYVKQIQIRKITPEPEQVISEGDETTFIFNAVPSKPMHADFQIRSETAGTLKGWVAVEGKPRHTFTQFVYP